MFSRATFRARRYERISIFKNCCSHSMTSFGSFRSILLNDNRISQLIFSQSTINTNCIMTTAFTIKPIALSTRPMIPSCRDFWLPLTIAMIPNIVPISAGTIPTPMVEQHTEDIAPRTIEVTARLRRFSKGLGSIPYI